MSFYKLTHFSRNLFQERTINMNPQGSIGLGSKTKPRHAPSGLDKFKLAVKPESKQKSLSQLLDSLPEEELSQLQSYGSMILKSTTDTVAVITSKLHGCTSSLKQNACS